MEQKQWLVGNVILEIKRLIISTLLVFILSSVYTLSVHKSYNIHDVFNQYFGLLTIPFVSVWIIIMYKKYTESSGKELLLSLPYNSYKCGLFRVIIVCTIYYLIFCSFFMVTSIVLQQGYKVTLADFYLPLASIIFFSSFSFLLIVLFKNSIVSLCCIGLYSILIYSTQGALTKYMYPFQWVSINPYYSNFRVFIVLLLTSIIMLILGQLVFNNREYLVK